jgi:hypothetical protein
MTRELNPTKTDEQLRVIQLKRAQEEQKRLEELVKRLKK